MKNSNINRMGLLLLMLSVLSCGNQNEKNTQVNTDQGQMAMEDGRTTILENDYATVVKLSLEPGESIEPHMAEKRVIYSLSDYSIEWEEQGEDLGTKSWKQGDTHFHEAGEHSARNSGSTMAESIVFTKKKTDLPDCGDNTLENDVTSVSPEFADVLFDNDEFKITKVTLPKGATIPKHSGINRIIYSLTDYSLNFESDNEGKSNKRFKTGDTHWHEACMHALENIGETEARYLVVSFKN